MDATLTQMLLAKRKPRFNIAEGIRALGYGAGGIASEYRPMGGTEQDNTVENYLTKALIERNLPLTAGEQSDIDYKNTLTEKMRRGSPIVETPEQRLQREKELMTLDASLKKEIADHAAGIPDPLRDMRISEIKQRMEILNNQPQQTVPDVPKPMSPILQKEKDKRTSALISTVNKGKISRDMITQAQESAKKIPTGLGGRMEMWWNRMFDPDAPIIEDWQKIKMVLTDAQLMNTANTKGAISDKEMALFARAAANDDIASIQAMKPVFNKLLNFLDAEEQSQKESYETIYGIDPESFLGKYKGMTPQSNDRNQAKQILLKKGYSEQEAEKMLGQ